VTRLRLLLATGLGSGYAPLAPGTFGSMVGVLAFWSLSFGGTPATVVGTIFVTILGFWTAGVGETHFGGKDPGAVVIDEVAGQMLTLLFLPPTWKTLAIGFFLFRLLDVLKPFPARRLESLGGGTGIMVDDLVVAIYANLLLQAVRWFAPQWLELG